MHTAARPEKHRYARAGGGLLQHRADRRSLSFVAVTLSLLVIPMCVPLEGPVRLVWPILSTLFCFNACIVNHNHIHRATFRDARLNEVFGHLLGFAKGHTSTGVLVAHNYNHHRFHGGERDWIRPALAGGGPGLLRLLRYTLNASFEMARGRAAAEAPQLPAPLRRRLQRERLSLWAMIALLLLLDWRTAMAFVVLPWVAAILMLTAVNLLQHDGCRADDPYRACRNFTGRLGNWFFLNNGFHTAHHLCPEMHWSLLRRYHEQTLAARVPHGCNEPSILRYLCTRYLLAPRRVVA